MSNQPQTDETGHSSIAEVANGRPARKRAGKRTKQPLRPKRLPIRTCVACREAKTKRELTRVVRTPDGEVRIDLTGKMNGRGCYLCQNRVCWQNAIQRRVLEHALKVPLDEVAKQAVAAFAAKLP